MPHDTDRGVLSCQQPRMSTKRRGEPKPVDNGSSAAAAANGNGNDDETEGPRKKQVLAPPNPILNAVLTLSYAAGTFHLA